MIRVSYLGQEKENNFGVYSVVEHSETGYLIVQFKETGTTCRFPMSTFLKNQCYDFMQPTVYGVGYLGEQIKNDRCPVKKKANHIWRNMMRRCYNPNEWDERPNYELCSVSENWRSLKVFKSYFKNQSDIGYYKEGYQLDKDLLYHGNKVYSEENCVFLPFILNSLQQVDKRSKGGYLPGVHCSSDRNKFKSEVYYEDKKYFLGRFNSEVEAFEKYKTAKEDLVRTSIPKWVGLIDPRAVDAFLNYSLSWVYETNRYINLTSPSK